MKQRNASGKGKHNDCTTIRYSDDLLYKGGPVKGAVSMDGWIDRWKYKIGRQIDRWMEVNRKKYSGAKEGVEVSLNPSDAGGMS